MKMIITAGGTGGHIYPALAIINEFKKMDKNFEVLYIGTHNRMENKIIPENNINYKAIKIYGFSKKNILRNFKNIHYIIKSFNECTEIMKKFKPDIVVGVGGYVTFPVLMAAKSLNIKTVIHEQNAIPGKTNKFLSKSVDIVFSSFKESDKYFKNGVNLVYSGNPSGDNVKNLKPMKKESLGFDSKKKLILITSGSLGSSTFNSKIVDFLNKSKKDNYEVLFVTGESSFDKINKENKFSNNIKVVPYLNNLSSLLKSCDLVISRSGASTSSEIMVSNTPSILVPSPYVANNHQYYNALELSKTNKAIMIEEKDLSGEVLYNEVKDLFKNNDKKLNELKKNLEKEKYVCSSNIIYKKVSDLVGKSK